MQRVLKVALAGLLGLLLLAIVGVLVLTRSDFGRSQVRAAALDALRNSVNGNVEIGALEGNLLGSFALNDVKISDSSGAPFITAERVEARVSAAGLISKRIAISALTLVRPVIHLTKRPDEDWNYERIFASEGGVDTTRGWGDWVVLRDVRIVDGLLVMERPWSPDSTLAGNERRQAIAAALAGETRARVDSADYGLRQTIEFSDIGARMGRIVVADPAHQDIVLDVDSASMVAAPFRPPVIHIRNFEGEVRVGPDTVTAPEFALELPETRLTGSFIYNLTNDDIFATLRGDKVTLGDLRALYPALPDSGGGRLNLKLAVRDTAPSEYIVTNADLRMGSATIRGKLGLVITDEATSFRDTDLTFSRFPTALIERLAPGVTIPVAGQMAGRAAIRGSPEAMHLDANVTFDAARHSPFRVVARGGIGFVDGLQARRLLVTGDRIPVSLAREFGSDPKVGGVVNLTATLDGSTRGQLGGPYRLVHNDSGIVSRIEGNAFVSPRENMRMIVGMRFMPLSLELAERFAPKTDFRGEALGSGRLSGTADNITALLDLRLPDTATVHVEANYRSPNDSTPAYTAVVTVTALDVQRIIPALPATTIEGTTRIDGRGLQLATLEANVDATLRVFMVDSAPLRDVVLKASASNGVGRIDTLSAVTSFAALSVGGTFGLVEGKDGTLKYQATVSDLAGLSRWIATGDTGLVAARPLIGARIARSQQYRDSVRREAQARDNPAAQLALEMRGRPAPRPEPPVIPPIARDSISGAVTVAGEAAGHVKRFNLTGEIKSTDIVWGGNFVGAGELNAKWTDAATPNNTLSVSGGVDSIRFAGFAFDSTRIAGSYRRGEGEALVAIYPGDTAEYRIDAAYTLRGDEGEVQLRSLRLRFDSTAWATTQSSTISWRGRGITIDSLELRNSAGRGGGRIFLNGEMPDVDPGRIDFEIDSLRVAPWLTLAQSDISADGLVSARGVLEGTRRAPKFSSTLALTRSRYARTEFPEVHASVDYADRSLAVDGSIRRINNGELAHVRGTLPLDLSLGDSVGDRLLDAPLDLTIEGDSIPLSPIVEGTDQITSMSGRAYGRVVVRGTWDEPQFDGALGLDARDVGIAANGVTLKTLVGRLRLSGQTVHIDSLVGMAQGPITGSGTIVLEDLSRPLFNLTVAASRARVLRDERGSLVADADLRLTGPLDRLAVAGSVIIRHGVIYIPDPAQMDIINTEDPAIFAVIDTATARQLDIAPQSTILENLRANVALEVRRGVFARSSDANVEVYGNLRLQLDSTSNRNVVVTGALYTDQGDYTFMGKRFNVTRGSVRFTGEPDPNPILQVLASYEVRQAGRAPLDIRVVIGGTMRKPNISLESDAQPTLSQSDLIAFLAFGQSSSSLLQFTGTGLEGGGQGGSSLAGNVAALAQRQLASIALGALVEEVENDLTASTRADVLNITPADLPADLSLGGFQTLFRGTEIEIGKYADRHTFVLGRVRPTLAIPGATVERRIGQRFTFRGTFETRFQPRRPSLGERLEPKTVQVLGALLQMRLAW